MYRENEGITFLIKHLRILNRWKNMISWKSCHGTKDSWVNVLFTVNCRRRCSEISSMNNPGTSQEGIVEVIGLAVGDTDVLDKNGFQQEPMLVLTENPS